MSAHPHLLAVAKLGAVSVVTALLLAFMALGLIALGEHRHRERQSPPPDESSSSR
jgi:hypothetical protein